jgi:hypothetical protein
MLPPHSHSIVLNHDNALNYQSKIFSSRDEEPSPRSVRNLRS